MCVLRARQHAWRAVNTAMVQACWQIGRYIVESEQGGEARASYGQSILAGLSARLSAEFGRGFSLVKLKYFRQFYLAFPIGHTVSDQSTGTERAVPELPPLTWSHFRMLLCVDRAEARAWYAREAVEQGWSVRALDRQIGTL